MHFRRNNFGKNDRGAVLLEAVICLPVLLLISLGTAQFAHIWLCRTMVQYAAYCGARAALTAPANREAAWARRAAEVVCASVAFLNPDSSDDENNLLFPGIVSPLFDSDGKLPGSGSVGRSDVLDVAVSSPDIWHRCVQVSMGVPLLFPLAGPVIGGTMNLFAGGSFSPSAGSGTLLGNDFCPRIFLSEKVYIVKPTLTTWSD